MAPSFVVLFQIIGNETKRRRDDNDAPACDDDGGNTLPLRCRRRLVCVEAAPPAAWRQGT